MCCHNYGGPCIASGMVCGICYLITIFHCERLGYDMKVVLNYSIYLINKNEGIVFACDNSIHNDKLEDEYKKNEVKKYCEFFTCIDGLLLIYVVIYSVQIPSILATD